MNNWLFVTNAGLNFGTAPPTAFTGTHNLTSNISAVISDTSGMLLFYADPTQVFNSQFNAMTNGNSLGANGTATGVFVVKNPGNNSLYYIFQPSSASSSNAFVYSIVDMALASGMGSVTVKNSTISAVQQRRFGAVSHNNGKDMWIITHSTNSNNFNAYLLTSTGLSLTPIISSCGFTYPSFDPYFDIVASTNGRRLATSVWSSSTGHNVEVYDFNRSTGIVSNPTFLNHSTASPQYLAFSPDGSKLYSNSNVLVQWDLCEVPPSALISSIDTVYVPPSQSVYNVLQLANDGRVYGGYFGKKYYCVINEPNKKGISCNYVDSAASLAGRQGNQPPRFYGTYLARLRGVFEYEADNSKCATASFTAPCLAAGNYTGLTWNFNDPLSGSANSSTAQSASHVFSSPMQYNVQLILHGQNFHDTLWQRINFLPGPQLNVTGKTSVCKGDYILISASGATTYSWSTGITTPSFSTIATSPQTVILSAQDPTSHCVTSKTIHLNVSACTHVEINNLELNSIEILPNPTSGEIKIVVPYKRADLDIKVINQLGELVLKQISTVSDDLSIILSLPSIKGLYFVSVTGPSARVTRRVVVE